MDKSYLGKGMKFPPQINEATGRFVTVDEEESVRQSIYIILMTQLGERPMRPDYGSQLMGYTFMDVNAGSINWLTRTIKEQISTQEPRVSDIDVIPEIPDTSGRVIFDIKYRIISSNTIGNLVFPFFMRAQSEQEVEAEEGEALAYEPQEVEEI